MPGAQRLTFLTLLSAVVSSSIPGIRDRYPSLALWVGRRRCSSACFYAQVAQLVAPVRVRYAHNGLVRRVIEFLYANQKSDFRFAGGLATHGENDIRRTCSSRTVEGNPADMAGMGSLMGGHVVVFVFGKAGAGDDVERGMSQGREGCIESISPPCNTRWAGVCLKSMQA